MRKITRLLVCLAISFGALVLILPLSPGRATANPTLYPVPNTHTAPITTTISITYSEPISTATVSTRTFAVHGMRTGLLAQTYTVVSGTISLTPTRPFRPGELVQVSATTGTLNLSGHGPISPTVWQFWTAVDGGTGVFTAGQRLDYSNSHAAALGDLDGDGGLDAFIACAPSQANEVWLNDGAGNLVDSGQKLGNSSSYAVALGDLDGDGDLDALVANYGQADKVWLNDGAGSFSSGQNLYSLADSRTVVLGDVDGDGDLDALIGGTRGGKVWLNDGTATFSDSGQSLGISDCWAVGLGDLDGDGDLDALVDGGSTSFEVWLNDGAGHFDDSGQDMDISGTDVALGDVDADGDLDVLIGAGSDFNEVWLNDGAGTFSSSDQTLGYYSGETLVALGDLDGDGDLDALFGTWGGEDDKIWLNDGTGTFAESERGLGGSWSWDVALGDVDGDGDLDGFVVDSGARVWLNSNDEPDVTVDPVALSVALKPGDTTTRTLNIGNQGDADLTWSLAEVPDVAWLSESPGSGTVAPSDSRAVVVTLDATGLADGSYATTLQVSSNDPDAPRVDVSVVLTVGSGDVHEPDDTCAQANALVSDGTLQAHTFHQHADEDWTRFTVVSSTTYVLQANSTSPDADLELELYDACGGALEGSDDNAFGNDARLIFTAPSDGTYYVKALNHDPAVYGPDVTYELSVRAQLPGGVVLIVAGHDDNYHLQDNILYAANFAYRTFRRGGIPKAHVRYLSAIDDDSRTDADGDGDSDVYDSSASAHVETSITTWAANLAGSRTPSYLYLIDHGGSDVFLTDGSGDTLTPGELDGWLNALEAATGTPVTVIYEACHSGSFIDGLEEISAPGRVVIASTGRVNSAYPAPGRGAYFSDAFFTALGQSQDLYTSFQWGVAAVEATGLWQTPWLDDNGNAVPNEADDGAVARGWGLANFAFPAERPPMIDWVSPPAHIENGEGLIRAQVRDDTRIARVWAVVYPPSFVEPDPSPDGTMPDLDLAEVDLSDSDGDGEYVGVCENFVEDGVYRLVFYAEDGEGNLSQPSALEVRTEWPVYLPLVVKQ